MSYMNDFQSIVTLSKRNHRYYGTTESNKMRGSFTEIATDLLTVFDEMDKIATNIEAIASGYLLPSGFTNSLWDLKRMTYELERKLDQRIYVQADQVQVLE
jgi:hypothetical protein